MNQESLVSKIIEASRIIENNRDSKGSYVVVSSATAKILNSEIMNSEIRIKKIKKIYNL